MALFLPFLLLAACAGAADSGGKGAAGVRGVVLLGPMCPVVRSDSPCPDRPLSGIEVDVLEDGEVLATAITDARGRFEVGVPAGTYTVRAVTSGIQTSKPVDVTVPAKGFVDVNVLVDSGIR